MSHQGETLTRVIERGLDIPTSLALAMAITSAVGERRERSSHVSPSRIRVSAGRVAFAESTAGADADLPYLAPEQTGRMNRAVDSRADLYSVGVILYEMLAGQLPFTASTPVEWVHRHVARRPSPLPEHVPAGVAAIVDKLLAKAPDDRYQTATGLCADLEHARDVFIRDGNVPRFVLADHDGGKRRLTAERAYGRESALAALVTALGRVASSGTPELILVSGPSGIGKSALVDEFQRSKSRAAGWFCAGKYEQFKREIPYATLAGALSDLVHQLLLLPDQELEPWRIALRDALGAYARLALEVVPSFALLLGSDVRGTEVPAGESKSRVHHALASALAALARTGQTLTLFIDDLQWSDQATLHFFRYLFQHDESRQVLVVGAFRDNEVENNPVLVSTLDAIRELGPVVSEIKLGPLERATYIDLFADLLRAPRPEVEPLAVVVYEKTGGNPFFALYFVGTLVEDGFLAFETSSRSWRWNLAQIQDRALTDNVVDLLIGTLERLPSALRDAVEALACLGTRGSAELLAALLATSPENVDDVLAPATRLGLIVQEPGAYRFAHDRVHEAAHQLASPELRSRIHLSIARVLQKEEHRDRAETIFELASHYNDAVALVEDHAERALAAHANLAAAERARTAGANAAATAYITQAQKFLGEDGWERAPELTARIELVHAQCDHLEARLELASNRLEVLASRATDLQLLAEVARMRAEVYFARGQGLQSLAACVSFLRQAGVEWPDPSPAAGRAEYDKLVAGLGGRTVESLASLPEITDPLLIACSNVLIPMVSPAGVIPDRSVFVTTILRMVNFALENGLSASAAVAFARVPEVLVQHFDDWERAFGFGRLINSIVDRELFDTQRGRVLITCSVTADVYMTPFPETRTRCGRGRQMTLAAGDVTYHNIALITELVFAHAAAEPLARVLREAREAVALVNRTAFGMMQLSALAELRLAEKLAGEPVTECEPAMLLPPGNRLGVLNVRARDLLAALLLGDDDEVIASIEAVEPFVNLAPMRVQAQEIHFCAAMAFLARGDRPSARRHVERFCSWGKHSDNYRPRMCLVEAEIARLDGRTSDASRLYDEAVSKARTHGFLHDEGLASERAERFYAGRGNGLAARAHRDNAHRAWRRWGAHGKLRRVDPTEAITAPTRSDAVKGLGMARIAMMAQAVTSEIDLDRLASKVLTLALSEGGALGGRVLLASGTGFVTLAEADGGAVLVRRSPFAENALVRRAAESRALVIDDSQLEVAFPFVNQGRLVGLLVLTSERAFAPSRLSVLSTLAGLSAIALEHARLFAELRTAEMHRAEAERSSRTGSFGWSLARNESTWSEEALAIFGYPPDTVPSAELFLRHAHPDDRARVSRELDEVKKQRRDWATEYRIVLPSSEQRHVQLQARSVSTSDDVMELSGAIIDVTSAKRLEDGLHASRRYLGVMLASIEDGVVVADEAKRITFMNRAAEKLTGWTQAEAVGQPYANVVMVENDVLAARDGRRIPLDERRSVLADDAGIAQGSVSVIRDATEQIDAARAESLALMNERIDLAFRGSGVGMWMVALENGQLPIGQLPVHTVNLWESLGWSTTDDVVVNEVRTPHPERIHVEDRPKLVAAFEAHLRGETEIIDVEGRFLHADGTYRWLISRGRLVRDQHGEPLRLIGTAVDITERRALESEIHLARDAAEAANRAKDEFLANVSHEVRTPMNAIIGMTELALSTNLSTEQRPWLTTVKSSADNLLLIIDELLDYSKAEANKLELAHESLSVRELLGDTLRALAVRAHRKGIELMGDVAEDVPSVLIGDGTRLRQILVNLTGNAIKFTNEGEVSVTIRPGPSAVGPNDVELIVSVRDTGIGISREKHAFVFEPFAQEDTSTTRRFGGTGLGLTIAARLATLMRGHIDLESTPGAGSTFTVHVQLGRTDDVERSVPRKLSRSARALVVDANAAQRDLLVRWCQELGVEAVAVADAIAAMEALWEAAAAEKPFDVTLLDTRAAAGGEGVHLSSRIRERPALAGCRIVALGRPGDARESWADARLEKPLTLDEIAAVLRRTLEPTSPSTEEASTPAPSSLAERAHRTLRILVGEDNPFNSDLVRELLTRRGHDVVIAEDGHTTLAHAQTDGFDLLLLDLHMPGIDGFQVVREIRDRELRTGAHLPVVALTARSRREDREKCLAAGMDDFLSKPLQSKVMFETIERLTDKPKTARR